MLMEGRRSQQTRMEYGKKICSPKQATFETKYCMLAARAVQIKDQSLRTVAHLIDDEWLRETWRRLCKGAAVGIDANTYNENLDSTLKESY